MKPRKKIFKINMIALAILVALPAAYAAEKSNTATEAPIATQQVDTVHVKGRRNQRTETVDRATRETLNKEMIQNNRDLVRYSPDVGVADQGRHSKGFAIRGVEDNRVGISIDGVALPDSEENSLYKRYGNLNTSRQSIDPELARSVEVVKGADSFNQGSGNLGGGVNYRTLEASDIVSGENKFGAMYRNGYASRNNEWFHSIGTGYQGEKASAVFLYSHRRGHEMESAGGFTLPEDSVYTRTRRNTRQIPDESTHKNNSYLAKWAYSFTPSHRVGISWSNQRGKNHIVEDSAVSLYTNWREADDFAKRSTVNTFYEFTPDSKWLSMIKAEADYQDTETKATNYEGRRERTNWMGIVEPAEPSDTNIRTFSTLLKRVSLRADSQPLPLGKTEHVLSLKTSASERKFDVLHQDSNYLSGAWVPSADSTMMHPIKTTQYYFSLHDKIKFNNTFSGYAGVRYDVSKHAQQDLGGLACRTCVKNDDSRFKNWSWVAGLNAQLNKQWQLGYNIGTGFRVPNASEMYFDYRDNAAGAWMSNPNLKAERSLAQNISLRGKGSYGELSAALHHTKYKDFLNEQETWEQYTYDVWGTTYTRWRPVQQMQNVDSAKIYGVELAGKLNLNRISPLPAGFKLFGSLGWNKGNMSNGADLLSVQPLKAIVGLDYEQPNGKWGVFSRLTYLGAKKAKDAKYVKTLEERCTAYTTVPNPWYLYFGGSPTTTECSQYAHETGIDTWPHLNQKAWVFDLYGFYKPMKQLTLRAGVYNLFDRKYHTWDSLRGLMLNGGLVNSVGVRPNSTYGGYPGLERYYAPGRNFTVSLEYKF